MRISPSLIALLLGAPAVQAQIPPPPPLIVHVVDCAQVPLSIMRVAEHTVTSIPMSPFPAYEDMKMRATP